MFAGEFSTPAAEARLAGVRISHTQEEHPALTLTVVCPTRCSAREGAPSGHRWRGIRCAPAPLLCPFRVPRARHTDDGSDWSRGRPLAHKSTSVVSDQDEPW